jgi:acyl-CoA thioester hydrolase
MSAGANGAAPLLVHRFHVSSPDVDSTKALFYGAPLVWAARMLGDWRREAGVSVSRMLDQGLGSPVVRTEVTYLRPLRVDDEVEGTLWYKERSSRSFTVVCRFAAGPGGPVAAEVQIKQVPVRIDADGKPRGSEMPPDLIAALEGTGAGRDRAGAGQGDGETGRD